MMWLILAELLVVCVATLAFVGMYAARSDWWSPTGRMVMSWALVSAAESGLFVLSYAVQVPVWLFALVFGATDAVVLHRLWLLLRVQWRDRQG